MTRHDIWKFELETNNKCAKINYYLNLVSRLESTLIDAHLSVSESDTNTVSFCLYNADELLNYFDKIKYVLSKVNYKLIATLHNTSLVPVRRLVFYNSKFVKYSKVDNYLNISMSFENYERFIC